MYYSMNLEIIEEHLMNSGISKLEFAKKANIDYTTLYRLYKNPDARVNGKTLKSCADVIGCKPSELVNK